MLAPWKKSYEKPRQHIKKQSHYFAYNVHLVKAMVFPSSHVWMWELDYKESWAWNNWYFDLWCWRRLLRVPWTARRSNQSILKRISPGYSLEGLMLKLKLQYFGHLMWRTDYWKRSWCWERLEAGGERDDRIWDGWMASPTQWIWVWASSRSWWWTGKPGVLQSMGSQRAGHGWATELKILHQFLKYRMIVFSLALRFVRKSGDYIFFFFLQFWKNDRVILITWHITFQTIS